jgi:hypothetical protein
MLLLKIGEISNIKVHLSGQPPFSFSYTRSQELLNGDIDTETSSISQVMDSQVIFSMVHVSI